MAKQSVKKSAVNVPGGAGRFSIEHQESYDDSLLPDAIELAKLKEVDDSIVEWIKERTAKEQDGRLDFNKRKMILLEVGSKRKFLIDLITIFCAFAIIMVGMLFSYYLIDKNQTTVGTIFAGATLVFAANAFLNFRKKIAERKEM